jgi:transposase
MNDYSLSTGKIAKLERLHKKLKDKRKADRIKVIVALAKGETPAQIAKILLIDESTSRRYFQRYQEHGVPGLLEDQYYGALCKLDEQQISELVRHLETHILPNAKAVVSHIRTQYGVRYSIQGVTDLLHRLGFSYKKPAHVPGKQDPVKQQAFLEHYDQIKANKGENDPVYFADATHPHHNSVPSYGWIKKGQRKKLKANCGRSRLNINGAINVQSLESVVGFYDTIKAQSTIDLCKKIEAKHPDADVIYIIVDNARYYRSRLLREFESRSKIKLIFLPPYSPNLNLIERYWKFFKQKVVNNIYYESFGQFVQACKSFFRKKKLYLDELKTLLTENFHIESAT